MGQYYHPLSIDKKQYVYSHDYQNGLKIMEHSYIGNNFMNVVESLLAPGGKWHQTRISWAGDYADDEPGANENLYHIIDKKIKPKYDESISYRYIINHSTRQYIDKQKLKPDSSGLTIHPLSLLTAEGNGRGGGDYHGTNMKYIGTWARNIISVDNTMPEGYVELEIQFVEGKEYAEDTVEADEIKPRVCPFCGEELHELNISYPSRTGTVDLDVPEDDEAPVTLDADILEPIVYCPECGETIPDEILIEWHVNVPDR